MTAQQNKAFTLVELLVTISIISLLMGILLPALSNARHRAQAVLCGANARQLAMANIAYAGSNEGSFVPAAEDMYASSGGLSRWHGRRSRPDEPFEPTQGPLAAYLADGKVNQCPRSQSLFQARSWDDSFEKGGGGYGYNMLYIGSRLWQGSLSREERHRRTTRADELQRPGRTVMFADAAFERNGRLIEYSFVEPPFTVHNGRIMDGFSMQASIHFRHNGRANIAWADGHVSTAEMADSQDTIHSRADRPAFDLGWPEPLDNSLYQVRKR